LTKVTADEGLLARLMDEQASVAATPEGGVDRPALTEGDRAARDWLRAKFDGLGMNTVMDGIGNMFGCLELAGPDAPWIMTGSHLDSQPMGGRFDGAYGVVAGLVAAAAMKEATRSGSLVPKANLAVCNWTNEEGARFQPSLIGSSVFIGSMPLADALSVKDGAGISVGAALDAIGYRGHDVPPRPAAYVEMHVECAPELEAAGLQVAPFTRYWGATKIRARFTGLQAHTGPTPMERRRDALLGAAYLVSDLRDLCGTAADTLYTSVGRIEVIPNSPNSVVSEATLWVELRSPTQDVLVWAEEQFHAALERSAARAEIKGQVLHTERRKAGAFDAELCRRVEVAMAAEGLAGMHLSTIAAHDAIRLAEICPSIVVAVRSIGGICHNAIEYSHPEDLAAGARTLVRVLSELIGTNGPNLLRV
jgi:beta-ureidopropionase / N-carbamoyl-L-amino-acid hydrolase